MRNLTKLLKSGKKVFSTHTLGIILGLKNKYCIRDVRTFLESTKQFIKDTFNAKNLLAGLGELIGEKQKYFVKHKLIYETIGLIDLYILDYK